MHNGFSDFHPGITLLYFALVLFFGMVLMHPACLAVALVFSFWYACCLKGAKEVLRHTWQLFPIVAMAAVINPLFQHRGATILAYFPTGNPLTLESILYGLCAAAMLLLMLLWFCCVSVVMTTDKTVYLLAKVFPSLGLLVSMALGFLPRFAQRFREVLAVQTCMGNGISEGKLHRRIKNAVGVLSIVITWSLERAVQTADSMKGRGYGLPGRTNFSVFRLEPRDKIFGIFLAAAGICLGICWRFHAFSWQYFPVLAGNTGGMLFGTGIFCYSALCAAPVAACKWEERRWKALQ